MRKAKNNKLKASKGGQKVQKGGVGAGAFATAPHELPFLKLPPVVVGKQGLGPVSVKKQAASTIPSNGLRVAVSELNVALLRGDDGLLYFNFHARDKNRVLRAEHVTAHPSVILSPLSEIGILATEKADKAVIWEKIHTATEDLRGIVATKPGYERRKAPRYFVYGDGSVITCSPEIDVYPLVKNAGTFRRRGKLRVYEIGVSRVLRNQTIPITIFFVGLSEALKPFLPAAGFDDQNMMIDLVGRSTNYKTALTSGVAGSIWGDPDRHNGYARRWSMSEQKIEDYFTEFNGHLLILDEATLAHPDPRKRGEKIADVVFRLASGMGRARTGQEDRSHSLTVLSSSNDPMKQILAASLEGQEALEVRLVSFAMPHRASKFFDHIPRRFNSVAEAMNSLFPVIGRNYGLLSRRFILNVLKAIDHDYVSFIHLIKTSMDEFISRAGFATSDTGGTEYRRIQPLALAYATAVVAFQTRTLKKKRWGHVRKTILRAWLRHVRTTPLLQGDPRFNSYMENPSNVFVDLRDRSRPELTDSEMSEIAGFIKYARDGALCLAIPKAAVKDQLGYSASVLKKLKTERILRAGRNLQTKLALRLREGVEKRDVFYVFTIKGVPHEIRFLTGAKHE